MANPDRPFPVFVVARTSDFIALAPDARGFPFACISVADRGGNSRKCLAWFTTEAAVNEFMLRNRMLGDSVRIADATEAILLLEKFPFEGIAIDPIDPDEKTVTTMTVEDLVRCLRN